MAYQMRFNEVTSLKINKFGTDAISVSSASEEFVIPTDWISTQQELRCLAADYAPVEVALFDVRAFCGYRDGMAAYRFKWSGLEGDKKVAAVYKELREGDSQRVVPSQEAVRLLGGIFEVPVSAYNEILTLTGRNEGHIEPSYYEGDQAWSMSGSGDHLKAVKVLHKYVQKDTLVDGRIHYSERMVDGETVGTLYCGNWAGANPSSHGLDGEVPFAPPLKLAYQYQALREAIEANPPVRNPRSKVLPEEPVNEDFDNVSPAESSSEDDMDILTKAAGQPKQKAKGAEAVSRNQEHTRAKLADLDLGDQSKWETESLRSTSSKKRNGGGSGDRRRHDDSRNHRNNDRYPRQEKNGRTGHGGSYRQDHHHDWRQHDRQQPFHQDGGSYPPTENSSRRGWQPGAPWQPNGGGNSFQTQYGQVENIRSRMARSQLSFSELDSLKGSTLLNAVARQTNKRVVSCVIDQIEEGIAGANGMDFDEFQAMVSHFCGDKQKLSTPDFAAVLRRFSAFDFRAGGRGGCVVYLR